MSGPPWPFRGLRPSTMRWTCSAGNSPPLRLAMSVRSGGWKRRLSASGPVALARGAVAARAVGPVGVGARDACDRRWDVRAVRGCGGCGAGAWPAAGDTTPRVAPEDDELQTPHGRNLPRRTDGRPPTPMRLAPIIGRGRAGGQDASLLGARLWSTRRRMPPTREARARPVGALQLLALGLNGIVGVGIFFVPAAVAASAPGLGAVAVFALTGPRACCRRRSPSRRSAAASTRTAGPVVFARAAFGENVSFLVGWVAYVSALFSSSAVIVGLTRARALRRSASRAARCAQAAPALARHADRRGGRLRPAAPRPRVDQPHRAEAAAARAAGAGLRRLAWRGLAAPAAGAPGRRLAARGADGGVRLPGLRDRSGDRRPGARVRSGRAAGDGRIAARSRSRSTSCWCSPASRRCRTLAASQAPLADTAGALGRAAARATGRRRHQRLRARDRVRHDGDHAALPLGARRRASGRSSASTASRRAACRCARSRSRGSWTRRS